MATSTSGRKPWDPQPEVSVILRRFLVFESDLEAAVQVGAPDEILVVVSAHGEGETVCEIHVSVLCARTGDFICGAAFDFEGWLGWLTEAAKAIAGILDEAGIDRRVALDSQVYPRGRWGRAFVCLREGEFELIEEAL